MFFNLFNRKKPEPYKKAPVAPAGRVSSGYVNDRERYHDDGVTNALLYSSILSSSSDSHSSPSHSHHDCSSSSHDSNSSYSYDSGSSSDSGSCSSSD